MAQKLIFTNEDIAACVADATAGAAGTVVLTDSNVASGVLPRMGLPVDLPVVAIEPGDANKTLATAESVWAEFERIGVTRRWMVVNLGGGVVTDLGGFVASTFKRGLRFVNVPTTLLAAVDAAVGGKTGVNFRGLKNEIGVFSEAETVVLSSRFYDTLPVEELLSGYGEVVKHALLSGREALGEALAIDPPGLDAERMLELVRVSVDVKRRVVEADPHESGLRKSLNLGHTTGHAIESLMLGRGRSVPHGYAVVWGLVAELVLSATGYGLPLDVVGTVARFVKDNYPAPPIVCGDYDELLELMHHDKKNVDAGRISFALLRNPGDVVLDCTVGEKEIVAALDIMRDLLC